MSHAADIAPISLGRIFFDAVLHPHRSLSPRAFRLLIGVIAVLMFGVGTVFMLLGAWPVMGFCGLELLLVYVMFRLNFRDGRRYEALRLSEAAGLEVQRVSPGGKVDAFRFEPTWLRVDIDKAPMRRNRLTLASHGRALVIGSFLTPDERLEVAAALQDALHAYRTRPPGDA